MFCLNDVRNKLELKLLWDKSINGNKGEINIHIKYKGVTDYVKFGIINICLKKPYLCFKLINKDDKKTYNIFKNIINDFIDINGVERYSQSERYVVFYKIRNYEYFWLFIQHLINQPIEKKNIYKYKIESVDTNDSYVISQNTGIFNNLFSLSYLLTYLNCTQINSYNIEDEKELDDYDSQSYKDM